MNYKRYFMPKLFRDAKGNFTYYDPFSDTAFLVDKASEKTFQLFQNRIIYLLAIFVLLNNFDVNPLLTILIPFVLFVLSYVYFYKKMITKTKPVTNFDVNVALSLIQSQNKNALIFTTVLYVLSIVLIVYLALLNKTLELIIIAITYVLYVIYKLIQMFIILN